MEIAMKIKLACVAAGISESELARRINTSPQNLHQRMKVGKFTVDELSKIADALGADFVFKFAFPDGSEY